MTLIGLIISFIIGRLLIVFLVGMFRVLDVVIVVLLHLLLLLVLLFFCVVFFSLFLTVLSKCAVCIRICT